MSRYRKVTGQPWIACDICGFPTPLGEAVRHYRTGKLVDRKCDDRPSWSEHRQRRAEITANC